MRADTLLLLQLWLDSSFISSGVSSNHNKIKDHSSTSTAKTSFHPWYLTSTRHYNHPSYATTTVTVVETTTQVEPKAAETEPAPTAYEGDTHSSTQNANVSDEKPSEEENNEIDLNHTTESPTAEPSVTTFRYEKPSSTSFGDETSPHSSLSNRIRSNKLLEENNSGRNMPESAATGDSFPWTWAKSILLEKPVQKKTTQD